MLDFVHPCLCQHVSSMIPHLFYCLPLIIDHILLTLTRCCTEDGCDELVMASNKELVQDKKVFSGARERWVNFEMPGMCSIHILKIHNNVFDFEYIVC